MALRNVFAVVSDSIRQSEVECVLIGAFAINFYGVSRQTADVDFLIADEDFTKIEKVLTEMGYGKSHSQQFFTRFSRPEAHEMDLDFIYVDKRTLEKIIKDGKRIQIGGQPFTIPSLNHLIALKLHSIRQNPRLREHKDLPDIIQLIRANGVTVNSPDFKALCLKFGTEELFKKIKNSARD